MKKIIVIGVLALSSLSFANHHGEGNLENQQGKRPRIESKFENLTEQQKEDFKTMRETYGKEVKEFSLNMKEVDIKMEKELMKDKPNRVTINKLIDEKSTYRVAKDKKMMELKLEAKEKFGVDLKRNNHSKMSNRNNKGNNKTNNKNPQHKNK